MFRNSGSNGWRICMLVLMLLITALSATPRSVDAETVTPSTLTGEELGVIDTLETPDGVQCLGATYYNLVCVPRNVGELTVDSQCNEDGSGVITFTASGLAVGPYPGPFKETGKITFGPIDPAHADAGLNRLITSFTANFTIDSPAGQVTGHKFLPSLNGPTPNYARRNASCAGGSPTALIHEASYEASIRTANGTFSDQGSTGLQVLDLPDDLTGPFGSRGMFVEVFFSALLMTELSGPATLTLTPLDAVNPVGTSHKVTATVKNASGQSVQGVVVRFNVQGSINTSGTCTTDSNGQCSFTYQGPNLPGADLIRAFADTNNDGNQDVGEPMGEATKAWVLPVSTPGQVTGGGQILHIAGNDKIAFGFNAKSTPDTGKIHGNCTVVDPATDTMIKCLDVVSLVQVGTRATLFGNAIIKVGKGQETQTTYRIDVDDLFEPGQNRDTFKIQTDSGYTAAGVLTQGNIQVHK